MSVGMMVILMTIGFVMLLVVAAVLIEWTVRRAEQRLARRPAQHRAV